MGPNTVPTALVSDEKESEAGATLTTSGFS